MGADRSAVKEKHEWNSIPGEELMEKHRDMEGEGKGVGQQHGGSPGYQSQPNSLKTHLVRKWGDTGHQRAWANGSTDGWMDCYKSLNVENSMPKFRKF